MNPTVSYLPVQDLLGQGLIITVLGMGLVFAALALLWGLLRLIGTVFAEKEEPSPEVSMVLEEAEVAEAQAALEAAAELTEERARVAAVVAGALMSNALPLLFPAPTGPAFEHGRVSPSWVSGNRTRSLQTWQPPRVAEISPRHNGG